MRACDAVIEKKSIKKPRFWWEVVSKMAVSSGDVIKEHITVDSPKTVCAIRSGIRMRELDIKISSEKLSDGSGYRVWRIK